MQPSAGSPGRAPDAAAFRPVRVASAIRSCRAHEEEELRNEAISCADAAIRRSKRSQFGPAGIRSEAKLGFAAPAPLV